ncbi:Nuclear control of ATPase protein 2 [Verticillium nonalfalfae]|uniref:Nuclear control of ATPase protein 2 n=1 Tax=Verticillium nonalfalfae TaxID=1051616 RepID=A0A3M9XZX8_9PEZI|nr:Nuclear control of ATPase protein 2 [Verticillium nonalfalfae]RNJ53819.1 Nuclear control of ATPase protein 2 [Verticillium nonalfalfae]
MSIFADRVRRLDADLDRISLGAHDHDRDDHDESERSSLSEVLEASEDGSVFAHAAIDALSRPRAVNLLEVVKALSSTSSSHPQLSSSRIRFLLEQSGIADPEIQSEAFEQYDESERRHMSNIEWLIISKATVQTCGLIQATLLDQIIPLNNEIWYWEEVLNSYVYSSIYTVQTSPIRLWALYQENKHRMKPLSSSPTEMANSTWEGIKGPWVQFYDIVRTTVRDRSMVGLQGKVLSPISQARREARKKIATLKKLREMTSTGLGILVDEALAFGIDQDDANSDVEINSHLDWKGVTCRSVALMEQVLQDVLKLRYSLVDYENGVFTGVQDDPELFQTVDHDNASDQAAVVTRRLFQLLETTLPVHNDQLARLVTEHGRPSVLVRYWLPATVAALSSTTVLRILVNRQAELIAWAQDAAATVRDFWANWIIEPTRKVVRTIRHDETSEIAIMSRDSLKADRESLQRMVVDFATDNPHFASASGAASGPTSALTETDIAAIRAKVNEGDVTPVLRAYEQDLRSPLKGAVRGDLIRSLLIQVQKTKVDLEVAISGIDALLKSQELVFGFVGLTPGILVSIGALQYLRGVLGGRKGARHSKKAGKSVRVLRNIDRIFSEATPTADNVLTYRDHGLLLCEVHVLRTLMHKILPRDVEKEFLEDLEDLSNLRGFQIQVRALDRIKWAYAKWLS